MTTQLKHWLRFSDLTLFFDFPSQSRRTRMRCCGQRRERCRPCRLMPRPETSGSFSSYNATLPQCLTRMAICKSSCISELQPLPSARPNSHLTCTECRRPSLYLTRWLHVIIHLEQFIFSLSPNNNSIMWGALHSKTMSCLDSRSSGNITVFLHFITVKIFSFTISPEW